MPIYLYQCPQCKTKFELRQNFYDKSTAMCPMCQGDSNRLFLSVPIIFKGSGFYVTDSRIETESSNPSKTAKDDGSGQGEDKGS